MCFALNSSISTISFVPVNREQREQSGLQGNRWVWGGTTTRECATADDKAVLTANLGADDRVLAVHNVEGLKLKQADAKVG